MSLSAAPILLHAAFVVLTLLLAATVSTTTASSSSVPVDHRDVMNTTTIFTNGSATSSSPNAENFEMYYCFLCTERHPLLIHYCPIYWDECHLNCWDETSTSTSTATAAAIPDAPVPVPVPPSPSHPNPMAMVQGKECYVMKLYKSGRYVIVERRTCDGIGSCFLTCGGGELDDDQKVAMGGPATTVPATTTTAAIHGRFVPFELCNTELVNAAPRRSPSSGAIVVPAGGAR